MLSLIVIATLVVMIGFLWHEEGWKKALKIIGYFLGSFILYGIIVTIFDFKNHQLVGVLIWGGWAVGLFIYNIINGHIGIH